MKLSKMALAVAGFFAAVSSLASTYTLLHPAIGSAAPAAPAGTIVAKEAFKIDASHYCRAVIHNPAALNTSKKFGGGNYWKFTGYGDGGMNGVSSTAQKTFDQINAYDRQVVSISFEGSNSAGQPASNANEGCENALGLAQSVGSTKTDFYGGWNTGKYSIEGTQYSFISAQVNTDNQTVSFILPGKYDSALMTARSYSLKLTGDVDVLKNTGLFPKSGGGGSTGATGNCFEGAADSDAVKHCLDTTSDAVFSDASTILYNGETYTATQWGGDTMVYILTKTRDGDATRLSSGKHAEIDLDTQNTDGKSLDINIDHKGSSSDLGGFSSAIERALKPGNTVKLTYINYDAAGNQSKVSADDSHALHATTNGVGTFAIYYPKDDVAQLVFSDASGNETPYFGRYTRKDATSYQYSDGGFSGCQANKPLFKFTSDPHSYTAKDTGLADVNWQLPANNDACSYVGARIKMLIAPSNTAAPEVTVAQKTDTTGGSPEINCSVSLFNPLSWFLCPLATALETVVSGLDNEINNYLNIKPGKSAYSENCSTTSGDDWCGYYRAWVVVRNISLGLIAVFALVAIVSQAMGLEVFDAYTIRKVLPRLLVAAIGITLSWPLMMWFINLTDALGLGVRQIIYAPFSHYKVQLGGGGQFVSSFFVGGAILALGFAGLLSFVATAALAAAVAFLVLTLRQMLIVMLVIFAPIAIACYVLPNTQKVWKLWEDSFTKGLLMFPIIAAFIAIGRVFAAVNSTGTGSINQIIAFTAYFAPYFLIPFTFRLAGGAISTIGGVMNDRSRGMFDRLKKGRQARMADRFTKAQNSQLWDKSSAIGRRANALASWATDPLSNAALAAPNVPGLRKRGAKLATHLEHAALDQSKKLLEEINPTFNDKAYRAINGGLHQGLSVGTKEKLKAAGLYEKTPQSLDDFNQIASILSSSDEQTERIAGTAIHGQAGRLATLYQDPEMGKASIAAAGMMGLASHGFLNGNDINPAGKEVAKAGGNAFAQAVGGQSQLLVSRSMPHLKAGYGIDINRDTGELVNGLEVNGGLRGLEMFSTLNSGDIAGAKGGFFKSAAEGGAGDIMEYILKNGGDQAKVTANKEKMDRLLAESPDDERTTKARWKKTAEGQEMLKIAEAAKHYESVKKVLLQNAGDFSHGSVDVQSSSAAILQNAGIDPNSARGRTPAEIASEPGAAPPPPPGGPGAPPPPGTGGVFPSS